MVSRSHQTVSGAHRMARGKCEMYHCSPATTTNIAGNPPNTQRRVPTPQMLDSVHPSMPVRIVRHSSIRGVCPLKTPLFRGGPGGSVKKQGNVLGLNWHMRGGEKHQKTWNKTPRILRGALRRAHDARKHCLLICNPTCRADKKPKQRAACFDAPHDAHNSANAWHVCMPNKALHHNLPEQHGSCSNTPPPLTLL